MAAAWAAATGGGITGGSWDDAAMAAAAMARLVGRGGMIEREAKEGDKMAQRKRVIFLGSWPGKKLQERANKN